jgi:hypothetical protein
MTRPGEPTTGPCWAGLARTALPIAGGVPAAAAVFSVGLSFGFDKNGPGESALETNVGFFIINHMFKSQYQ